MRGEAFLLTKHLPSKPWFGWHILGLALSVLGAPRLFQNYCKRFTLPASASPACRVCCSKTRKRAGQMAGWTEVDSAGLDIIGFWLAGLYQARQAWTLNWTRLTRTAFGLDWLPQLLQPG